MGQRNLLDRPFLQFQTGINIVVRRLPAEVGVDGEDVRVGKQTMESSMS